MTIKLKKKMFKTAEGYHGDVLMDASGRFISSGAWAIRVTHVKDGDLYRDAETAARLLKLAPGRTAFPADVFDGPYVSEYELTRWIFDNDGRPFRAFFCAQPAGDDPVIAWFFEPYVQDLDLHRLVKHASRPMYHQDEAVYIAPCRAEGILDSDRKIAAILGGVSE